MSPLPERWSVDVDGTRVLVRVPGRPDEWFSLGVEEARTLKNQLHVAYLIAGHQRSEEVGCAQGESGSRGHEIDDSASQRSEELPFSQQRPNAGRHDDLSPMPVGWHIETVGRSVRFEVPASGVDGEFTLTAGEALVAGIALIRVSEQVRRLDEVAGDDDTSPELIELLARAAAAQAWVPVTRTAGFAEEAHRQSALVASSTSAAEDQAWVDDISEFSDEYAACDSESEAGDQE